MPNSGAFEWPGKAELSYLKTIAGIRLRIRCTRSVAAYYTRRNQCPYSLENKPLISRPRLS